MSPTPAGAPATPWTAPPGRGRWRHDEPGEWQVRLEELGIEHGGIVDAGCGSGLSFRHPDDIALERFAPPS